MSGRISRLVIAVVLVLPAASAVAGVSAGLSVGVPPRKLTVGDRLPVRITASGGSGLLWGTPKVEASPGSKWAVVEGPRAIPQAQPPAWELILAPVDVGKLELPAISVSVRDAAGSVSTITADHLPVVTVETVLPPGQKVAPAPLDDPVGVTGFPWERVPLILAILLPLLLLGFLAWWLRRRRKRGDVASKPELPPLEALRAALDHADRRIGSVPLDEICDEVSGAVRRFVERRAGVPAVEMTTSELVRLARRKGWPAGVQRGFGEALNVADAVRFARRETAEEVMRTTIRAARSAASELDDVFARLENEAAGKTEVAA